MDTKVRNMVIMGLTVGGIILSGLATILSPSAAKLQEQIDNLQSELDQIKKV